MTEKTVILSEDVKLDIEEISNYIVGISRPEHAEKYVQQLLDDIASLRFMASVRPESQWMIPKRFHPHAKVLPSHNKKWSIIFHIDNGYAIVDRLLPSCMITY